jgi:hypothetical protein
MCVIIDGAAQLFAGATAPQYRQRGSQTAVIAARAQVAAEAGCRWVVTQTGVEGPGTHNSSLHNLLRLGFQALYERPNWKFTPRP